MLLMLSWKVYIIFFCCSYDPEYGFDPDCYRGEGGRDSGYSTHGQVKNININNCTNCQARVWSPKVKTKRTLADTKIAWVQAPVPTDPQVK